MQIQTYKAGSKLSLSEQLPVSRCAKIGFVLLLWRVGKPRGGANVWEPRRSPKRRRRGSFETCWDAQGWQQQVVWKKTGEPGHHTLKKLELDHHATGLGLVNQCSVEPHVAGGFSFSPVSSLHPIWWYWSVMAQVFASNLIQNSTRVFLRKKPSEIWNRPSKVASIDRSNYVIATVARGYHPKAREKTNGSPTASIN